MARLIVEQIVSADGTAEDAEGGMSFLTPESTGGEADREQLRRLAGLSAIVLGANTYRMFASYWPTASEEEDPIAGLINRVPKHVLSNSLDAAPWGDYPAATVERGDVVESLRRLKAAYPGEIILWGSLRLADAAFLADEVDVLRLRILPSVLGGGRGIVPESLPVTALRLVSSSIHPGGQVALEYEVGAPD
ncbi:dihydrofolate reductase family protein [Leifsonia sp. NPDC056824]|uniref:dihydrofolate reductase family protein n=1 Tax=Leifsonia sp. NPDC056824 TaxID=3345953 RepID=UPI003690CC40